MIAPRVAPPPSPRLRRLPAVAWMVASAALSLAAKGGLARPLAHPSRVAANRPHPAVVRVVTEDRDGRSYGSGALVAVEGNCGLVLTNWHVVRDAAGKIMVIFPDGFSSPATLLGTDRMWDLAALAVWCSDAEPIRLASKAPRPGDLLTIAGYGPGWYRAATGRCTQYVAPAPNQPFEMVELSVAARQGDSGGPILNERGELAGILFGAAHGTTTGSYCGRIRKFLDQVTGDFDRFAPPGTMIARTEPPAAPRSGWMASPRAEARQPSETSEPSRPQPVAAAIAAGQRKRPPAVAEPARLPEGAQLAPSARQGQTARPAGRSAAAGGPSVPRSAPAAAPGSRAEQLKNILAAIGLLALLFHGLRLVGSLQSQ